MKTLKKIGKIALWFASILLAFLIVVFIWLWSASPGETEPITDKSGEVIEGSIAEISYQNIGGIDQFLIIRGESINNPVLLMLHGGPGSPQAHMNLKYNNSSNNIM